MEIEGANPYEDRGPMVLATTTVLVFLATVFGLARFYARTWIRRQIYLDDLFIAVSVLLLWYSLACTSMAVSSGLGRHVKTLTVYQQERVVFWYLLIVPGVLLALGIPKLAVATVLNRILAPGPKLKATAWGLAISSTLAFFPVIFIAYFHCLPVRSQWDFSIKDKKCIDLSVRVWCGWITSAYSSLADLFFAVWPAVIFCSTQMSRAKTIRLSLAMGFGAIASGIAAYKCVTFSGVIEPDFSWENNGTVISTIAEGSALVIAASIPMLAPLFRSIHTSYEKLRHRILGTPISQAPQPQDRADNNAWDFPTRRRMRPRDDTELGPWSLPTSAADSWGTRHMYSSNAQGTSLWSRQAEEPEGRTRKVFEKMEAEVSIIGRAGSDSVQPTLQGA
ncbi:hypothetical protein MAPG_04834 [Magnaporthiopsis poae ATCC 64411]|uniref:Rhodopsin domain-containing protein n=1 Tax=Magnaporthiopsis poae (strain ATCC 64411 / 73-15) TaxID=644358 RepID=A0A0C4DXS7_MAGP6|nr:hypothetical protein MAPG_04834 [Magnaporthiopsis poae ATCC 64411]